MAIVTRKNSNAKQALLRFQNSRSERDFDRLRKIVEPKLQAYVGALGIGTVEQVFDAVRDRISEYDDEGAHYWLILVAERAIAEAARKPYVCPEGLSDSDRELHGLLYRDGLSWVEIGQRLGITIREVGERREQLAWRVENPNSLASGPAKLDLDALLTEYRIPESDHQNFRLLQAGVIQGPLFRRKLDGEYAGCYQAMLDRLSEPFAHLYRDKEGKPVSYYQ